MAIDSRESKALMRDIMFIAGIGNPKRKPTEKDTANHLNSKNYGASIS